ncbi:hypothetical protein Lalb_Chr17g0343401 [Lupinus albus]|uniref:Uncharacterized protein n=1 Tax=Lupinus albus TaxID=3870 RepID=A0A6A4NQ48_LUPAL|nr:hypothetical protein Lalb_Chr17g0343401 [Lupinus albus]
MKYGILRTENNSKLVIGGTHENPNAEELGIVVEIKKIDGKVQESQYVTGNNSIYT